MADGRPVRRVHDQVQVGRRAGNFAPRELVGGVVVTEKLALPFGFRWSRRMGVASTNERGKDRRRQLATYAHANWVCNRQLISARSFLAGIGSPPQAPIMPSIPPIAVC